MPGRNRGSVGRAAASRPRGRGSARHGKLGCPAEGGRLCQGTGQRFGASRGLFMVGCCVAGPLVTWACRWHPAGGKQPGCPGSAVLLPLRHRARVRPVSPWALCPRPRAALGA